MRKNAFQIYAEQTKGRSIRQIIRPRYNAEYEITIGLRYLMAESDFPILEAEKIHVHVYVYLLTNGGDSNKKKQPPLSRLNSLF